MQTLFIGSTAGNSGKTLITVGLGLALRECGYKVGYLKPLGKMPITVNGKTVDADAQFLKGILQLTEPVEQICPVVLTQDLVARGLRGEVGDLVTIIAYAWVSQEQAATWNPRTLAVDASNKVISARR